MEWTIDEAEAKVIKLLRAVKEHGHGHVIAKVLKHRIISVDKNEQNLI